MEYITKTADVGDALNGQLRHHGKPVIVINENVGTCALQVLAALSLREGIALKAGLGIVCRGADRRWRKVSATEIANIVREEFVITRLEVRTDGVKRLRIVQELPRTFCATIQQTRWQGGNDVESWFKRAE